MRKETEKRGREGQRETVKGERRDGGEWKKETRERERDRLRGVRRGETVKGEEEMQ